MEESNIKKLTEGFFKNLKCKIEWRDSCLFVENVPENFEKDFGKKSPYLLVFNRDDYDKYENSELVAKGSVLLKIIASYLEERGQTTLIKLDFNASPEQILKDNFDINDYIINGVKQKEVFDYLLRFIFLTNFQYVNERDQLSTDVYIKDGEVIDNFNLDDFKTIEGKKEELPVKDIKEEYVIAKEKLKEIISDKTKEIVSELNFSLETSINRIKSHYLHQVEEIDKEIRKHSDSINSIKDRIERGVEKDVGGAEEKIKRLTALIEKLENSEEKEKFEKEKDFYINDEKQKHSLNLNNKLVNTSIIYYPIYNIDYAITKKNKHVKHIELIYNPLKEEISEINCENCGISIKKINVCNSNHLYCMNCRKECICGMELCKKCEKIECGACGRPVCTKCGAKCSICNKYTCSSDMCRDSLTNKHICNKCAKYCSCCNKFSNKANFSKCVRCNSEVCNTCSRLDFKLNKRVCNNCYKPENFRA